MKYYLSSSDPSVFWNIGVFWYHKNILSFLEKAVFSPDATTFEIYCQLNPGYQFKLKEKTDMSNIVRLHKTKLDDFWQFNVTTRVMEIIQFYTDRLFMVPKNLLGTPYIQLQNMKLKKLILIPQELFGKIHRFLGAVNSGRDVIHELSGAQRGEAYHAECFDNLIKDMYTFVNMVADTNIASIRSSSFVPLQAPEYLGIVKWLSERIGDALSIYSRDTDLFFQMLRIFMYIHHMQSICGNPVQTEFDYHSTRTNVRVKRNNINMDPTHYLKNPDLTRESWVSDEHLFEERKFREIEEAMMYYGHLTIHQALCTRAGILPSKGSVRTPSMDIVRFLAMQEYFYGGNPCGDEQPIALG